MARPRIGDVARLAGVSKTAVSFAFNQPDHLNEATRDRILAIATELGYRPSPLARRLTRHRTDQIGLVVPQATHEIFANPFLSELVRGLGDECDAEGISLVIVPPVAGSLARSIAGALVDGLVLLGLSPHHPQLDELRRVDLPVVALDVELWEGMNVIRIDDEGGGRSVGEHLRALGHRDVAAVLIAEDPGSRLSGAAGISGRRLAGLRDGLGLPPNVDEAGGLRVRIVDAVISIDGGRAAFDLLVDAGLPTAIFAVSDLIAIGVLLAAADAGIRVPEELSIVGFDDIPAASWTAPRLTTVYQPIRQRGRQAARVLIDRIRSDGTHRPISEQLGTRLVVRETTAPPRRAPPPAPEGGGGHAPG